MTSKDFNIEDELSSIIFITGGTKSGKSEFAEYLAKKTKNCHILPYQKIILMIKNGKKRLIYIENEDQKIGS